MKKIFNLILPLLLGLIVASSCDKIEGPYLTYDQSVNTDVVFPDLDTATVFRKVLLEEYTGHGCVNCPNGHIILNGLLETYGERLVAISVHAGDFARPEAALPQDFRTPEGNELNTQYGIVSNPTAVINRKQFNSTYALSTAEWNNTVSAESALPATAAVQLIVKRNDNHTLTVHSKTTFIRDYENPVQLAIYLTESGILAPQKNGNTLDTAYIHNHVLRTSLNGTFGKFISTDGTVARGESYLKSYQLDYDGKDWNIDNCHIVAILMDADSKEVLQVETCRP